MYPTEQYAKMKTCVGIFEATKADQFLYQKLLQQINLELEPIFFENINEGVSAAQKGLFDVVVIDVHFHGDNTGLDILQKLRKASPREFIAIAVISLLQDGDLERILAAGFAICLEKPVAFQS